MNIPIGSEYWLISLKSIQPTKSFEECKTTSKEYADCYQFPIPDLKVGTLDTLISLADELVKHDIFVESVTKRIARLIYELVNNEIDKVTEALRIDNITIDNYIKKFRWDMAKYPIKQSLKNIVEIIIKLVGQIEADMKSKATHFNNIKNSISAIEKRSTGNLVSRSLNDIVKKEDFIRDSEYLMTVLVVVPRTLLQTWWEVYEALTTLVVPRSCRELYKDNEASLMAVIVFKKNLSEFRTMAMEQKFSVREYEYNEADIKKEKRDYAKLITERDKIFAVFNKWLKVNFADAFSAWVHIKAVQTFVESVLRYGLPVNFVAILVEPNKKSQEKLRGIFNIKYADMDRMVLDTPNETNKNKEDHMSAEALALLDSYGEYYPYVSLILKTRLFDS